LSSLFLAKRRKTERTKIRRTYVRAICTKSTSRTSLRTLLLEQVHYVGGHLASQFLSDVGRALSLQTRRTRDTRLIGRLLRLEIDRVD
jgi:hypothetical protein